MPRDQTSVVLALKRSQIRLIGAFHRWVLHTQGIGSSRHLQRQPLLSLRRSNIREPMPNPRIVRVDFQGSLIACDRVIETPGGLMFDAFANKRASSGIAGQFRCWQRNLLT
jgi:hypothetical protein